MRALFLESPLKPDSLKLIDVPTPTPQAGEVRVKFTSIGLNRADLLFCQGRYFIKPEANSRMGFEGAGIVDAIGESIAPSSRLRLGDSVALCPMSFDVKTQGSFAEYGIYPQHALIRNPENLDQQTSGAIWMAYLTAWGGLINAGQLIRDETVVITAASNSVGIAAIQIAKMLGAKVIATTTSESKVQKLKELGAHHVICQNQQNLNDMINHYVNIVKDMTENTGSDLVFDAVAGPMTHALIKASRREGRIVIQGMLDRKPMDIHAGVLMKRLLTLKGYTVGQILEKPEQKQLAINSIILGVKNKKLFPVIAQSFKLEQFQQAFELLKSNQHFGKIIIIP